MDLRIESPEFFEQFMDIKLNERTSHTVVKVTVICVIDTTDNMLTKSQIIIITRTVRLDVHKMNKAWGKRMSISTIIIACKKAIPSLSNNDDNGVGIFDSRLACIVLYV